MDCYSCEADGGLERTRFFPCQIIAPDDLTQDQIYFNEKLRRHNRLLHGWGVVCGVQVRALGDCKVSIEPGYVLGPQGHEIVIKREVSVDLCKLEPGSSASPCDDPPDPWCSDIPAARRPDQPLYIAVRYAECETRPVRAVGGGCGCDSGDCQYSRIRDGFTIGVLTELPKSYQVTTKQIRDAEVRLSDFAAAGEAGDLPNALGQLLQAPCPSCPEDPWVILAEVVIQDRDNIAVDCFRYRRYVVSLGHLTDLFYQISQGQKNPA